MKQDTSCSALLDSLHIGNYKLHTCPRIPRNGQILDHCCGSLANWRRYTVHLSIVRQKAKNMSAGFAPFLVREPFGVDAFGVLSWRNLSFSHGQKQPSPSLAPYSFYGRHYYQRYYVERSEFHILRRFFGIRISWGSERKEQILDV